MAFKATVAERLSLRILFGDPWAQSDAFLRGGRFHDDESNSLSG
ncbi:MULTISPECIES: hypothetical protein [Brucella/Ochrobactrum group]|nr:MULTISPECIES: hypothetical protein [Brucella/Ochrobactrum group]